MAEQIDFATEAALQPALVNEGDSTNDEVRRLKEQPFCKDIWPGGCSWLIENTMNLILSSLSVDATTEERTTGCALSIVRLCDRGAHRGTVDGAFVPMWM